MKTKLTIVIMAALFFAAPGNLAAAGSSGAQDERAGYRADKRSFSRSEKGERRRDGSWLEEKLELTEAQREKLREHRNQRDSERKEIFTAMRDRQQELREELAKDEVNRQKIDKIIEEIASLQKKQLKQRTESLLQLREVLTDEQWNTIKEQKRPGGKSPARKPGKKNYPER